MPNYPNKSEAYRTLLNMFRQTYGNAAVLCLASIETGEYILTILGTDEKITLKALPLADIAEGDLLYVNASGDWVRLPHGTAGQVLETGGADSPPVWDTIIAEDVVIPDGEGSPTYENMQDFLRMTRSAGRLTGGVITAHSPANGTVDISALEGMIFTTEALGGDYIFFKQAGSNLDLTASDNVVYWVYFDWNGGSPQFAATTTHSEINTYDQFAIGRVWRSGNTVEVMSTGHNIFNKDRRAHDRLIKKYNLMDRVSGGVLSTHATPLRLSCTAGSWYVANYNFETDAADTFKVWYKTSGTWTQSSELTLFSAVFNGGVATVYTSYQDGDDIATLNNNKYGVYWLYLTPESELLVVLGEDSYNSVGEAQEAGVPSSLPPKCINWATLVGRVILQKSAAAFYSVDSAFTISYTSVGVTVHNDLGSIQGGTTGEYYHLTSVQHGYLNDVNAQLAALQTDGSPVFVTTKLSGLTDGKIPYHVDDATGLADGPTKTDVDSAVSLKHAAVTIGTANGLSLATQELSLAAATSGNAGAATATQISKLDGIEALADVTDATNVATAGAVMEGDTTTAAMSFVIDEDNMASNLATKIPTQQSVKAYADLKLAKASNLFDVANAATAFGNIKQSATTSATGVVELATQAEVLAGTDTSRAVVPADLWALLAQSKNPLALAQAINMTYTASGSSGITVADNDNIDFGTGNFALVWKGALPDWTGTIVLISKRQDDNNRFALYTYNSSLRYYHFKTGGTTVNLGATNTFSPVAGSVHQIVAAITRETVGVAGSATYYVDGALLGSVAISAGTPADISNTGNLQICGLETVRYASTNKSATLLNFAPTAAEVLDMYTNGIPEAWKWGSQTAVYTSDFSAGVDGWAAANGTVTGNIDGIGGEDDVLKYYANTTNGIHNYYYSFTSYIGKKIKVSFQYYIPSTNTHIDNFKVVSSTEGSAASGFITGNVLDAWTTVSGEQTFLGNSVALYLMDGTATSFAGAGLDTDDLIYIKDVVITQIGATLALEPEGIQPSPGQWLDSSSNKLHAWQPAAGSSLTRYKNTFEIRGINTWAGTHEAQSIAWATDASKAILPSGCYIDSIIGVITGATIEDIIIGDGSDTDRWVAATTGLAAGTVAFTIANHISDGTNYEMVVDPDANFTGSIEWTIRGTILD